jgi:hypothetical protein
MEISLVRFGVDRSTPGFQAGTKTADGERRKQHCEET